MRPRANVYRLLPQRLEPREGQLAGLASATLMKMTVADVMLLDRLQDVCKRLNATPSLDASTRAEVDTAARIVRELACSKGALLAALITHEEMSRA